MIAMTGYREHWAVGREFLAKGEIASRIVSGYFGEEPTPRKVNFWL